MVGFFIVVAFVVALALTFNTLNTIISYRKWEPIMRKRVEDAQDNYHKALGNVRKAEQRRAELLEELVREES